MKLTLLGTGSPVPSLKRSSAGYMVQTGGDVILIDNGPGTFQRMMQAGATATEVTHVFLSHLHFDHCLDFLRLFLHRWDMSRPGLAPLKVYGPPGLESFVEKLFGRDGAFALDLTARTSHPNSLSIFEGRGRHAAAPLARGRGHRGVSEHDVLTGDTWRMTLANVPHHQPYLVSYGVRLEADSAVFAYSSDITLPVDKAPAKPLYALADKVDLLVHYLNSFNVAREQAGGKAGEAARTKQQAVGELARDAGRKDTGDHPSRPDDRPGTACANASSPTSARSTRAASSGARI